MPNVSAYWPDYLFHAVIGVSESYPSKSHVSKDLQDELRRGSRLTPKMQWNQSELVGMNTFNYILITLL